MTNFIIYGIIALLIFFGTSFILLFLLFNQKEKYFRKHVKVGDMCIIYISETEHIQCEIISIKSDIVDVKDKDGEIYNLNIDDIASV